MPLGQLPQKAVSCVSEIPMQSSGGRKWGGGGRRIQKCQRGMSRLGQGEDAESWSELKRGPRRERRRDENGREIQALASG